MGKAYKAPPPTRKRHRFVSGHAVERLRERIIALDLDHRLDADLEQWLDAAVEDAIRRGDVEAIMDRKESAKLVNIGPNLGVPAFALVKPNNHARAEFPEVVITIMDDVMVTQYRTGRWRDDKFRSLAGLAKIKLPPVHIPQEVKPVPLSKLKSAPAPEPEEFLLSYVGENGVTYELVTRLKLKTHLVQLALDPDIDTETIRAWREVKINVQVSVDVKL